MERCQKICGSGGLKGEWLESKGVGEVNLGGVQSQPLHRGFGGRRRGGGKIEGVLEDGMTDGEQVSADLMRVATMRRAFHQGAICEAFEDAEIGAGGTAVGGIDDGAVAAADIDAQGAVDAERFPGGLAETDGQIAFVNLALLKSAAELLMGQGGLGEQDQTAGVFIQTVNDPGLA